MQNKTDKKEQQMSLTQEEVIEVLKRTAVSRSDLSEQERYALKAAVQCMEYFKGIRKVMQAAIADLNYMANGFASRANGFIPDDNLLWRYRCDICKNSSNQKSSPRCDALYNKYNGEHCFKWLYGDEADRFLKDDI